MSRQFLAVDVGGSRVKWSVVEDGHAGRPRSERVARGLDALVAQIVRIVENGAARAPDAWGLSVPGLVDSSAGVIRYSANLELHDAPVVALLAEHVPRPAVFVNDLVAAAAGEAWPCGTLALLQIGTGIAARQVVGGTVVRGASGYAGEVGHLRFRQGGRPCHCGRNGCVEAYVGWGAIAARLAERGITADSPSAVLANAAVSGWTRSVVEDAVEAVGFAAAVVVSVCEPGLLRLGGGLTAAWGDRLIAAVRGGIDAAVLAEVAAATRIEQSELRDRAALIGLYALAK